MILATYPLYLLLRVEPSLLLSSYTFLHLKEVCMDFRKDFAFIRLRQPTSQTCIIAARTNWIFYEELAPRNFFPNRSPKDLDHVIIG